VLNGWRRSKRVRGVVDEGVDGWLLEHDKRKEAGEPGVAIPETALVLLASHALLAESRWLKRLTVLLALLTIVLAALTWRLAFR